MNKRPGSEEFKVLIANLFEEAMEGMSILDRVNGNCYTIPNNWKRVSKRGKDPIVRIFKNTDGPGLMGINESLAEDGDVVIEFDLCEKESDPDSMFPMWVRKRLMNHRAAEQAQQQANIPKPESWGEFA